MSLTKCEVNTDNIQNLADAPSLSASELKKCFDKVGKDIKDYLNNILIEELQNESNQMKNDFNNESNQMKNNFNSISNMLTAFEDRIKKLEKNFDASQGGTTFVLGDVNGDGIVDNIDAELVLKHFTGTITLTEEQLKRADVDGDGKVTSQDAALIRRMAIKDGVELASTTSTTEETISIDNINNYRFILIQVGTLSTAYVRVLGSSIGLVSQFKTSSGSHNWQASNADNPSTYGGYVGYVNDTTIVMKSNSSSCRVRLIRN